MLALLKEDIASSFSDLWYRVGPTRPRLSTHARITQHFQGGDPVYIVEDPAGGGYYRLSGSAYFFLGLLDGARTVDDAWNACNAQLGDAAPSQRECIDLLSKLQYFNLLTGDLPLAADMIERRRQEASRRKIKSRTGSGLSLVLPVLNPEPVLERCKHLLTPIFSWWGLAIWLLVIATGAYGIFTHRVALAGGLNGVLDPSNLVVLSILLILIRAWHELGHAAACKAMGGRCTEMGIMLVCYILPFPYCDTSSAWRFPQVWKRVLVSAGGMLFELFLAGIAAIVWANTSDEAHTLRLLTFNTMFLCSVTTLLFNANPLLRYDGYYILSDLAGIPNLAQRALELSRFLVLRHVFKVTSARPPSVRDAQELALLTLYTLLSTPYRLAISAGIVLFLWRDDRYFSLGAILAIAAALLWIIWPALKGIAFLAAAPSLLGRRSRAVAICLTTFLLLLGVLGLVPFPSPQYSPAVLEPRVRAPIRPQEDGFIDIVHVNEGDSVHAGDPLLTLRNPGVVAELGKARAEYEKAAAVSNASGNGTPAERTIAAARLNLASKALARAQQRSDSLIIRAAASGHITPAPNAPHHLRDMPGTFVAKGALLGLVAATQDLVVRSVVDDSQHAFIFDPRTPAPTASFRVRGDAGRVIKASITRNAPVGSREIEDWNLTTPAGGPIALDPRDPQRRTTLSPQFEVELAPESADAAWQPGLRANVRFDTQPRPLLVQWYRSLRMYIGEKTKA